jgi:hypothetical protein
MTDPNYVNCCDVSITNARVLSTDILNSELNQNKTN